MKLDAASVKTRLETAQISLGSGGSGSSYSPGNVHGIPSGDEQMGDRNQAHQDWVRRMGVVEERLQQMKQMWGVADGER